MEIKDKSSIIMFIFCFQIIFQFQFLTINSILLNSIIRLGDNPFRYSHFSFSTDGDMIVDSGSYPITNERRFYGIKKDGRGYFSDSSGNKIYQTSMTLSSSGGRVEGQSCIIKLHSTSSSIFGKEFLFGVSKAGSDTFKTEFYDLNERNSYSFNTLAIF